MKEYNINYEGRFSDHSNENLQAAVRGIKVNHPNSGQVMVQGHLRAQGINVQRSRIRSTIRQVDPLGTLARQRLRIHRRVYSVPYPNYLWHIDGNHKLIRWRFVLHHGIDGFSRLVTFGKFSGNNRAETVLQLFREAVETYGQPRRIRTDYGGENVDIWKEMVDTLGEESCSVVVGSSVHNQRIERHNRSVNEQVISSFKNQFYELESEGILDPANNTDLYCLHYIFLPRLNRSITEFMAAHNNHPLSTEANHSPLQLFCEYHHLITAQGDTIQERNQGMDVNQLLETRNLPHVEVNDVDSALGQDGLQELMRNINPLSDDDGKELYRRTIRFVGNYLTNEINN